MHEWIIHSKYVGSEFTFNAYDNKLAKDTRDTSILSVIRMVLNDL